MATESKHDRIWNWLQSGHRFSEADLSPSVLRLRANFENREAICIEKGALRVRVSNICGSASEASVSADIEEVLTPGLGVGLFDNCQRKGAVPRRWGIGAGYLSGFSDHVW